MAEWRVMDKTKEISWMGKQPDSASLSEYWCEDISKHVRHEIEQDLQQNSESLFVCIYLLIDRNSPNCSFFMAATYFSSRERSTDRGFGRLDTFLEDSTSFFSGKEKVESREQKYQSPEKGKRPRNVCVLCSGVSHCAHLYQNLPHAQQVCYILRVNNKSQLYLSLITSGFKTPRRQ